VTILLRLPVVDRFFFFFFFQWFLLTPMHSSFLQRTLIFIFPFLSFFLGERDPHSPSPIRPAPVHARLGLDGQFPPSFPYSPFHPQNLPVFFSCFFFFPLVFVSAVTFKTTSFPDQIFPRSRAPDFRKTLVSVRLSKID